MGQSRQQRRQTLLVNANRPGQRMPFQPPHQLFSPHDHTGLRPPQQLVPGEKSQPYPGGHAFLRRRFVRQPIPFRRQQTAAAHIMQYRDLMSAPQSRQFRRLHRRRKSLHPKVAGVSLEQSPGVAADGIFVVPRISAVRCPHIHQLRPALRQNLRHPKSAPNFHRLAPGRNHRLAGR